MVKINQTVYAGIIVTLMMLASGTTYYLQKTGDYKNCYDGGWQLQDSGQYECKSRELVEWCYELSAVNKDKIQTRCYIGKVIFQDPDEYGDFAERITGHEMVRHVDTDDYEIWLKTDEFNVKEVEGIIEANEVFIQELEEEYSDCKYDDEKVNDLCKEDVEEELGFLTGESAMFSIKLDKVK